MTAPPVVAAGSASVRVAVLARRVQLLALAAVVVLLALLMGRFMDTYREEAAHRLTDGGTSGELDLATWAAWATSWVFNSIAYAVLVLALGALGAACCRFAGAATGFRDLRFIAGAVFAGYLAIRTAAFLAASWAGVGDRTLLDWFSRPEPGLVVLVVALALTLRRAVPELRLPRTVVCALVPAVVLGLLMALF